MYALAGEDIAAAALALASRHAQQRVLVGRTLALLVALAAEADTDHGNVTR